MGKDGVLMNDGASVNRSNDTKEWLSNHSISCLEWPARSPDIKVIENVWGMMVRSVYREEHQCSNLRLLALAIVNSWEEITRYFLKNIYISITRRLVSLLEKKGMVTDYTNTIVVGFQT